MAVDSGLCVFTDRRTWLTAVECATGVERWSVKVRHPYGRLAFTASNVIYQNGHQELIALDRDTGELVWRHLLLNISGWLHGYERTVVVGGWRGYSDIFGLDAADGAAMWTYPARGGPVHSTKLHADSNSVAVPEAGGALSFLDMRSGIVVDQKNLDSNWDQSLESSDGATAVGRPLILDGGSDYFFCIRGPNRRVERVSVPRAIRSVNLASVGECVPFLDADGAAAVWLLDEQRPIILGHSSWRTRGFLPFCRLSDRRFVVAIGDGALSVHGGEPPASQSRLRVGKRVSTALAFEDGVLLVGTGSGDVLGLTVTSASTSSELG